MADPYRNLSSVRPGVRTLVEHVYGALGSHWPAMWVGQGWSSTGGKEHQTGRAVDLIIGKLGTKASGDVKAQGDKLAEWLWKNRKPLQIRGIIWYGRLIGYSYPEQGWRIYRDQGSISGNHYDHIHVMTNLFDDSQPDLHKTTIPGGNSTDEWSVLMADLPQNVRADMQFIAESAVNAQKDEVAKRVVDRLLGTWLGASGPTVAVALQDAVTQTRAHAQRLDKIEQRLASLEAKS